MRLSGGRRDVSTPSLYRPAQPGGNDSWVDPEVAPGMNGNQCVNPDCSTPSCSESTVRWNLQVRGEKNRVSERASSTSAYGRQADAKLRG